MNVMTKNTNDMNSELTKNRLESIWVGMKNRAVSVHYIFCVFLFLMIIPIHKNYAQSILINDERLANSSQKIEPVDLDYALEVSFPVKMNPGRSELEVSILILSRVSKEKKPKKIVTKKRAIFAGALVAVATGAMLMISDDDRTKLPQPPSRPTP